MLDNSVLFRTGTDIVDYRRIPVIFQLKKRLRLDVEIEALLKTEASPQLVNSHLNTNCGYKTQIANTF